MRKDEFDKKRSLQRAASGYLWSSAFMFPSDGQYSKNKSRLEDDSLSNCRELLCKGWRGCQRGDCCYQYKTCQIMKIRQAADSTCSASVLGARGDKRYAWTLERKATWDLKGCWDETAKKWSDYNHRSAAGYTTKVCPTAWCALRGGGRA